MSDMERNKGKLVLVSSDVKLYAEHAVKNLDEPYYDTKEDQFREEILEDESLAIINGKVYAVDWEHQRDDFYNEFAEVSVDIDGTISFHTYHYNGGAHWTEVVEDALKKENN